MSGTENKIVLTLNALKEAIDFIHSNLRDAGVEFENESEILFWIKDASDNIEAIG